LKVKKPGLGWCTNSVHDGVHQGLKLLDPVLCKVLMLVVRLTLPVTDAISTQNLLDLVADFNLCPIAGELSRGSPGANLVFQVLMNCLLVFMA